MTMQAITPWEDGPELARDELRENYEAVRCFTEYLCEPLELEDYVIQSMPQASPAKWHLAHTSWFFEQFVLCKALKGYQVFQEGYKELFNSYYNSVGPQFERAHRGLISRPGVEETMRYRHHVDRAMQRVFAQLSEDGGDEAGAAARRALRALIVVGLQHEQQHQELILTDIKHAFFVNPLRPVYRTRAPTAEDGQEGAQDATWYRCAGGVHRIGAARSHEICEMERFSFDNEMPRHSVLLEAFEMQSRLVTNGEYLEFIEDGGYENPSLWLSEGWQAIRQNGWTAPMYWELKDHYWMQMSLSGMRALELNEPVCHVSYYEADAFARWAGARLPSEAEWEVVAALQKIGGNFVERLNFHPVAATKSGNAPDKLPLQLFGDVWEWTSSPYISYPGYRPWQESLGEYNSKFMCNQQVLRGGSCATSSTHIRATYRNFFSADTRWQFAGFRLAR